MKVIHGHLTGTEKKAIKALFANDLISGRVGRTEYFLNPNKNGSWDVVMKRMDRGWIPCPGSPLRLSTYRATFFR